MDSNRSRVLWSAILEAHFNACLPLQSVPAWMARRMFETGGDGICLMYRLQFGAGSDARDMPCGFRTGLEIPLSTSVNAAERACYLLLLYCNLQIGQSGVMNLGAFMDRLGGRMDGGRVELVDEVFDRLDTSGKGHLALSQARERHFPLADSCVAEQNHLFCRARVTAVTCVTDERVYQQ